MKVLALVPYPLDSAPGQRYRLEQWAPYLKEEGIEVVFAPFASRKLNEVLYARGRQLEKAAQMLTALARRVFDVWDAGRFDAIYVQREACLLGPAWAERLARWRQPAFVYDFDDAVYLPYVSPTNRYLAYLKFPWKTAALCHMASAVVAGNHLLAEWARPHNANVHVVPSTVSLRAYRPRPHVRPPGPPVIGWTGSHSSAPYLKLVEPALRRLGERFRFRFLVIGVEHVQIPGVDVECRPWSSDREVKDLWDMDIGIMPLPDDPWTRGKCGMKALQYMGVGLPAVVSPVGVNRDIVHAGANGDHARDEEEWVCALARLLEDESRRQRMGRAAYRRVAEEYSAEVHAPRVAGLLRGLRS